MAAALLASGLPLRPLTLQRRRVGQQPFDLLGAVVTGRLRLGDHLFGPGHRLSGGAQAGADMRFLHLPLGPLVAGTLLLGLEGGQRRATSHERFIELHPLPGAFGE